MNGTNHDINDLFSEIVLSEERIFREGFQEGLKEGRARGNLEGFHLGYIKGLQLGEELGEIYGTVVALLQKAHLEGVRKTLLQLRHSIDTFPRTNDPEKDLLAAIEEIRSLNKRMRAMLRLPKVEDKTTLLTEEKKDLSF